MYTETSDFCHGEIYTDSASVPDSMTISKYFTPSELATLRNAVTAERDLARNAQTYAPDSVVYNQAHTEITRLTRLLAKLLAPCVY